MILLKDPPLIFLKPRKVAGTSFEIALSKYARDDSIITPISPEDERTRKDLGFWSAQNYKFPFAEVAQYKKAMLRALYHRSLPEKYYNHIPAQLAKQRLGDEIWRNSFKISIVRNPFDQLVSLYFWRNRGSRDKVPFASWLTQNPDFINFNRGQVHLRGELAADFLIRYEAFEEDIQLLEKQFPQLSGLWQTFSSISAKSGIRPEGSSPASFFEGEPGLVEAVKFFNADIIEKFNYQLV